MSEGESAENNLAPVQGDEEIQMDDYKLWCSDQDLKPEVVAELIDCGFESIRALSLMRDEDIEDMDIRPRAQIRLLQEAISTAKQQVTKAKKNSGKEVGASGVVSLHSGVPKPIPEMTIDSLLSHLPVQDGGRQIGEPAPKIVRPEYDPTFHLMAGKNNGAICKPLEIIDYVGMSVKIDQINEEIVSEVGENHSLILKTGPKKPKYDSLTVWQWCLGAIRIQDELVRLGRLPTEIDRRHYWGYICKVLELNSRYEWQSILEFDKEYRSHQARFEFAWGTEITHLCSVQLRDKRINTQNNFKKGKQSTQPNNGNKKGGLIHKPCRDFNRDRCVHNPCRFLHVCSVDNCGKSHPASKHDDNPKN